MNEDTNQLSMKAAKIDKYTLHNVFISHSDDESGLRSLRAFKEAKVFVPAGELPEVFDLTEKEAAAAAIVAADATYIKPEKRIDFKRAFMITGGRANSYQRGLSFYGSADFDVEPVRDFATFIANPLLGGKIEEDGELTEDAKKASAAIGLGMLLDITSAHAKGDKAADNEEMMKLYGDSLDIREREISSDTPFAMVAVANLKGGKQAIATEGNKEVSLRLYNELHLFVDPGTKPERVELNDAKRADVDSFDVPDFNPVAVLRFGSAGMMETVGGTTGIALGEIAVFIDADTEVSYAPVWMPKEPFEAQGFTNFLANRIGPPTEGEQKELIGRDLNEMFS